MTSLEKEWSLGSLMLLLIVVFFSLDISTPLSFANHILYALVVLIATLSRFSWMPSVVSGIGTGLTIVGGVLSPAIPSLPHWIPIGNRAFTVLILWVLVWFAWKRLQAETALQQVNERLEGKVAERTRELVSVNQALVSEVTERIESERAFQHAEGRLAGILDIAEDAIIVMEQDRAIVLFNRGAVKLFGYEADEMLGQCIDVLLPKRFRQSHVQHIDLFANSSGFSRRMAQRREVFGLKKDGSEFPAEASISKLVIGDRTTFTVILRDISDRLRTERQLQSLTSELMAAQEEERRRIARELHDDINQRLALLAIEMGSMESAHGTMTEQAGRTVQSLAQQLATISDDVRRMAYQFHPSVLDDLGLAAALQHLADTWSAKTGIKTVVVQQEMSDPLPRDFASCLYRIAQESLANVFKHARAYRVELELTYDGQEITLSIEDNGVGFDLEQVQAQHLGLGLVNMRERVRSVQGHFDIQSEPGRGTHITVQIPLPGASHEETTSSSGR